MIDAATPPAGRCSGAEYLPLARLASAVPLTLTPETSRRQALERFGRGRDEIAVVIASTDDPRPVGVVALRELLRDVAAAPDGLDTPVGARMRGALPGLDPATPAYQARFLLARQGVRHLALVDAAGRLTGLVGQDDLLGLRAADRDDILLDTLETAPDLETLVRIADAVRQVAAHHFAAGLEIESLCHWISGFNDLITIRVIDLVRSDFALPEVHWCWLAFGSEGRLEQTFTTDQDNGILFAAADPAETGMLRAAFLPFAQTVNEALHRCGFERCRGNIMAGNPQWCLSGAEWQQRFGDWLRVPDPQALLHGTIFFDFRAIYGQYELADALRAWLHEDAPQHPRFFRALAELTLGSAPPLGWMGRFLCDRHPGQPPTIDLKLQGARYFMDSARLWALKHGVWATGTADRMRAVGAIQDRASEETGAEIEAFLQIQRLRMQQQQRTSDLESANRVAPAALNRIQQRVLRESFRQAAKLQLRIRQAFSLSG